MSTEQERSTSTASTESQLKPVWGRVPGAGERRPTREEAIAKAGATLAVSDLACAQMTPREQAEAAWTPTSQYSVDELEDRIRARRGLPPLNRDKDEP